MCFCSPCMLNTYRKTLLKNISNYERENCSSTLKETNCENKQKPITTKIFKWSKQTFCFRSVIPKRQSSSAYRRGIRCLLIQQEVRSRSLDVTQRLLESDSSYFWVTDGAQLPVGFRKDGIIRYMPFVQSCNVIVPIV